jgi:hypothetical protein
LRKPNQQTSALKAAIFRTFNEMQLPDEDGNPRPHSLIAWASANPKEFYTGLLPRLLPKPVEISAAEGVSFALVYQVGDDQVVLGEDGQALALPDPDVVEAEVADGGSDDLLPGWLRDQDG